MRLPTSRLATLSLAAAVGLVGCEAPLPDAAPPADPAAPAESAPPTTPAAAPPPFGMFVPNPNIRMAFRDFRPPIGAENGFSIRQASPEEHAITAPPSRSVRPMVEWEPMRALVLAFPGEFLSDTNATGTIVGIIRHAHEVGQVWILVDSRQAQTGLSQRLVNAGVDADRIGDTIVFHQTRLDSIWIMDFSPLPIVDEADGTFAFADFRYYFDRPVDDGVPTRLGRLMPEAFGAEGAAITYRAPLDTEGGTLQATSDGICFTSSRQIFNMSCLDPDRNGCDESILSLDLPSLQAHRYTLEMKGVLGSYAGCRELVITHSVSDDGTGHLDMYFKLLDDDRILLGEYREPFENAFQQENAELMDENAAFLETWERPGGGSFTVERMIMPGHRVMQGYGQVPFTYLNATFFNGLNLWPATDFSEWRASRDEAQATWERVLPDMQHQWLDATNLSFYSGAIHCVTRTIPDKVVGAWIGEGECVSGSCDAPAGGYSGACEGDGVDICFGPAWLCDCNDCEFNCQDPCEGVGYEGCCADGDVVSCENGRLVQYDCGRSGCGWNGWGGYYDCGESGPEPSGTFPMACAGCEPRCDGRTCGDDGCGGSCGECSGDIACVGGTCREDCFECEPGEIGCDGTVAWLCNAPVGGCKTHTRIDCADSGRMCEAGDCILPEQPEPGPDAGPEEAPDAGGDVAVPGPPAVAPKDDGCGAGAGGAAPLWLALAALGLLAARRRREALSDRPG